MPGRSVLRGLMLATALGLVMSLLLPSVAVAQDGELEELQQFWLHTYGEVRSQEVTFPPADLLWKAPPDECYCGIGEPYPAFDEGPPPSCAPCDGGNGLESLDVDYPHLKVNQSYVWGMAKSGGDIWFGTMANTHCLVMFGFLGVVAPHENHSWVCEMFSSQYPALFPSDWRPPRIYLYDTVSDTLIDKTADVGGQIWSTLGIRSAGTLGDVVFLGGPMWPPSSPGIRLFAFNTQTRAYLGSTTLPYGDIRKWLVVDGVLYAGMGDHVVRWTGDQADPFQFQEVGNVEGSAAYLAFHDGRIFVSTWPDFGGGKMGIWMSPPVPPGGLTAPPVDFDKVWDVDNYEPDPVTAATYGGGALASFDGYLYWGTMHVPFMSTMAHVGQHSPSGWKATLMVTLGSWRAISIFRGRDFGTPDEEVEVVYGLPILPVLSYNEGEGEWEFDLEPNNMHQHPLWGLSGFGNFFNNYTWSMAVCDQELFVGTMDWSYLVFAFLKDFVTEVSGSAPERELRFPHWFFGADLWRFPSSDEPATPEDVSGVGNWSSYGVRNMVADDDLYLGMANPMNLMTDPYDAHPEGGCELIRLGVGPCVRQPTEFVPEFVPESASLALLGSGLGGLAGYGALRWRARRKE